MSLPVATHTYDRCGEDNGRWRCGYPAAHTSNHKPWCDRHREWAESCPCDCRCVPMHTDPQCVRWTTKHSHQRTDVPEPIDGQPPARVHPAELLEREMKKGGGR